MQISELNAKRIVWVMLGIICLWGAYRTPELGSRFWPGLFWGSVLSEAEHYAKLRRERYRNWQEKLVEQSKELKALAPDDPKREELSLNVMRTSALSECYRHYARLAAAKLSELKKMREAGFKPGFSCPVRP